MNLNSPQQPQNITTADKLVHTRYQQRNEVTQTQVMYEYELPPRFGAFVGDGEWRTGREDGADVGTSVGIFVETVGVGVGTSVGKDVGICVETGVGTGVAITVPAGAGNAKT
jgi:hypothetical protein